MAGIVVRLVHVPHVLVIVDMRDEQTAAGKRCVPTCALAILHDVELVSVGVVIHDVSVAALRCGLHVVYLLVLRAQLYGCEPSCHPFLVSCVVGRAERVFVVAA